MMKGFTMRVRVLILIFMAMIIAPYSHAGVDITKPLYTITDDKGVVVPDVTKSTSIESALAKASNLPSGIYKLKHDDITITVTAPPPVIVTAPPVVTPPDRTASCIESASKVCDDTYKGMKLVINGLAAGEKDPCVYLTVENGVLKPYHGLKTDAQGKEYCPAN